MDSSTKLQLHYYFYDKSHSIDALLRNKCEKEIIDIVYEVASILGLETVIEAEASSEGGFKETWDLLGKNSPQLSLLVAVIALVLSQTPRTDSELQFLQKELIKVTIDEKKLSIKKLKNELEKGKINNESVQDAVDIVNQSYKVIVRRSNFYKEVDKNITIKQVSYLGVSQNKSLELDEKIVPKRDFKKFILSSNVLKPIIVDEAIIEIVAPVLNGGKTKWKGIYSDEPINFSMNDSDFVQSVIEQTVSFQNDSTIIGELKIHQKLNEIGEVVITGHTVTTVIEFTDGSLLQETSQGKHHRFVKKQVEGQRELFH